MATDSFGTHIGYSVSLNVPCNYFETSVHPTVVYSIEQEHAAFANKIIEDFKTNFRDSQNITAAQLDYCNKYWGLDQIKTQDEIKAIYEINVEITRRAKGFVRLFPMTARKLLDKYEKESDLKYRLLKEALPKSML
jgi:hypothetical protein